MTSWWTIPETQQDRSAFAQRAEQELQRMAVSIKDRGMPVKEFDGINRGWGWPDRMKKEEGE